MNYVPASLSSSQLREAIAIAEELDRRKKRRKLYSYFPDSGPLRRELYAKHMEFFRVGARYRERALVAGNRIGKTEGAGGYETTLHMIGYYPHWWAGRRFDKPISAWASGTTNMTTRDIVQKKLLGPINAIGTGVIPGDSIVKMNRKAGVQDAFESIVVKHSSGGESVLCLKSYEQGRKAFEGTEQDVIWLDEEPPADIYGECLIRTMTTDGIIICTFTPLEGITEVVKSFLPGGQIPKAKQ
jgi:phage terminase large subunit-like protein